MKATVLPPTEPPAGPARDDQRGNAPAGAASAPRAGNWLESEDKAAPDPRPIRPPREALRGNPPQRTPPSRRRGFTMPASDAAIWDDEPPGTRRRTGP